MNVILLVADGLQVAALGAYGNDWISTPNFDHLATESVVFDQHFTDVPSAGAVRAHYTFPPNAPTPDAPLPQGLRVVHLPSLRPPWNSVEEFIAEQFEDWEFEEAPRPWLDPRPGWLDTNDDVLFARLQRTYAAAVREFDERLGAALEDCPRDDLLLLTAGRGQNLGEHGLVGDVRPWLHEEMVHLPLLVRLPNGEQAGRRVAHLTQTVDIAPTILDALGIAKPADWHGHSLLPLCRGAGAIRPFACLGMQVGEAVEYALQTGDAKIIVPQTVPPDDPPRQAMFFVKPDDRWEVNDLRQSNLDYAEELEQTLRQFMESMNK